MNQNTPIQSLEIITEDITLELNSAAENLELYSENCQDNAKLILCVQHLRRLRNVFTMCELQGARRFVCDIISVVKKLPSQKKKTKTNLLVALSSGLVRLGQFVDYAATKPFDLPQLLLPSINELRGAVNATLLPESYFFNCNCNLQRFDKSVLMDTSDRAISKSRHFRQMYQIGLIEVIRQTNIEGGLKMMQRALQKLDDECIRTDSPNLWWIAQGLIDCYIDKPTMLNRPRIKIFSRLDRQIRRIEMMADNLFDLKKSEIGDLAKEMLYLVWLSASSNSRRGLMLTHFQLDEPSFDEKRLSLEFDELQGPSEQDFTSLSAALLIEIQTIQSSLHSLKENDFAVEQIHNLLSQMIGLNNLIKILRVDEQIIRLTVTVDILKSCIASQTPLSMKDFNIILSVLERIKQSINEGDFSRESRRLTSSKVKRSKEKEIIRVAILSDVKKLIGDISMFVSKKRKVLILKDVDKLLNHICAGAKELAILKIAKIIQRSQNFIQKKLKRNPHSTNLETLELLADAIGSVEYYLETLAFTRSPSSQILDFACNSLDELDRISGEN